jgi:hypothetical protein
MAALSRPLFLGARTFWFKNLFLSESGFLFVILYNEQLLANHYCGGTLHLGAKYKLTEAEESIIFTAAAMIDR